MAAANDGIGGGLGIVLILFILLIIILRGGILPA